jgi:NADPH-dependent glutamate synthase beta subunit-like oxidoreductase
MNLPFAITLGSDTGLSNKTGSWRTQFPRYLNLLPPCNHACPAGENTQKWLYFAEEGRYEEAWRLMMEDNPLPAIHGRVCYHPCESECNRGKMSQGGGPVSIHAVERYIGDLAVASNWTVSCAQSSGKAVLVVGSGPCGLSCAYHLARLGHHVVVCEAGKQLGGMMRYGIPAYRLPRDVLDFEIRRIASMGVEFQTGVKVKNIGDALKTGSFSAGFLAIGAGVGKHVDIPALHAGKILNAINFLQQTAEGKADIKIGQRVAVYGGGNTAMDAARVAQRLGAQQTVIIYRRDRDHAPAYRDEIQEALDEGILVHWLRTIKDIAEDDLHVEIMKLDEKGAPTGTGQFETLQADTLILALGQDPQNDWLKMATGVKLLRDGSVEVDEQMMTGYPGLFAGGDMVPTQRTVATAVGHGHKAARNIDAYLRGEQLASATEPSLAQFSKLNTWYYSDAPKSVQPELDRLRRLDNFDEIAGGLSADTALYEARRCMSCGNCFGCDNCYGMCPDNAIVKLGAGKFQINLEYCKGCGICAQECPCGAIEMVEQSV